MEAELALMLLAVAVLPMVLPLMVVAGAAGQDAGEKVFADRVMETTLSAFRFGPAAA